MRSIGYSAAIALALAASAEAGTLPRPTVPVIIEAGDTDPCSNAVVHGLRVGGDGFLSVRAAPSANARELSRLYNGQTVFSCSAHGVWLGIVYGRPGDDCNVTTAWVRTQAYTGPCRSGWVHSRWVEIYAG